MHRILSKNLYRFLQNIRGEPVFNVLKEIEESQWFPIEDLKRIQWERLKKLISYVYDNIPFYRERLDSHGISPREIRTFEDFRRLPLLTKKDIRENGSMLSPAYRRVKFTIAKTSGSTGTPLSIRMSQRSWAYHHANIIRALSWHKLDYFSREARIGSQSTNPIKKIQSKFTNIVSNRIFLPASNLNDEQLERFFKKIHRFKPLFIYGYPTTLFRLAKFIKENGHDCELSLRFAVSHGEELEGYQRELIQDTLKCRVINGYGAAEVGIIAYECPGGNMHIPAESIYVEVIESEGEYEDGIKEIAVTDLHNYAMPLLRYRIGDLGILSDSKCSCDRQLPIFSIIKGKIRDIIETPDGRSVHTVIFNSIFKDLLARGGKVDEWQVIQKSNSSFSVNIVRGNGFNDSHLSFLADRFHRYLGAQVQIDFKFLDEIKRHPSGKFRAFIREWQ